MIHKPSWFRDGEVMVSTAPTCGLTKGGRLLPLVDRKGRLVLERDIETDEMVVAIDDVLKSDMEALRDGRTTDTLRFINEDDVSMHTAVPTYYDQRFDEAFDEAMKTERFDGFTSMTLGELIEERMLTARNGHGSPTQSVRVGTIPYIKVSDLRAGLVNINPTNRVPKEIAKKFWKGEHSGLRAWDLICPSRTSKNIGDFCMMMPGQEEVVTTKEVIVLRPGFKAQFDSFYLMWAMTLNIVRDQWKRVVFMQTNREDVGNRYLGIRIPVPISYAVGQEVSQPFRDYYQGLAAAREGLQAHFASHPEHHFFIGDAADIAIEDLEEDLAFVDADTSVL
jgi:hypothetical protein